MASVGKRYQFHGSYKSKAEAVAREQEVKGFIREHVIAGHTRYFVLTEKK